MREVFEKRHPLVASPRWESVSSLTSERLAKIEALIHHCGRGTVIVVRDTFDVTEYRIRKLLTPQEKVDRLRELLKGYLQPPETYESLLAEVQKVLSDDPAE